jgi:predicted DNA-binding transcriptional regulator AlpA
MKPSHVQPAQLDPELVLLDETEVAPILGWSVSTLQKDRIGPVRVPFVRLGRRIRYRLSDVKEVIRAGVVTSAPGH